MVKINVEDMTCMHCMQTIQKSLIKNGIIAQIDLSKKCVNVREEELEKALEIIKLAGYTPKV